MITNMKQSKIEGVTKEEIKNLGIIFNWFSSKIGNMVGILYDLHKENQKFFREFYRKQRIIEGLIYGYRGRDYQTSRA